MLDLSKSKNTFFFLSGTGSFISSIRVFDTLHPRFLLRRHRIPHTGTIYNCS